MYGIATLFILLAAFFWSCLLRILGGPRPIGGLPYKPLYFWLPIGSIPSLAVHFLKSGQVFDWLSLECLHLKSPIVQLFLPSFSLTRPVVLIADLHEIKDIVTRRSHEFDRANIMHSFFGLLAPNGTIAMQTGPRFKQQRRLWNSMRAPHFTDAVVVPRFYASIERLVRIWQVKARRAPDHAFEVELDIQQAALECMWELVTGTRLGLLAAVEDYASSTRVSPVHKQSKLKFEGQAQYPKIYTALSTMMFCLDWTITGVSLSFYTWLFKHTWILPAAEKIVDQGLQQVLDDVRQRQRQRQRQAGSSTVGDRSAIWEVLLKDSALGEKSGAAGTDESLKSEMVELLITGHETTGSTVGWALKYLSDHPRSQKLLRESLLAAFPDARDCGSTPSSAEIVAADLPYLDAVVAETLRMSRTGPVSFRQTQQDCNVLGHRIPSGTTVVLVTAGPSYDVSSVERPVIEQHVRSKSSQVSAQRNNIHHWPEFHPITSFEPNRWLDADGSFNEDAGPSLPFSAGPRGCFGKRIALLELRLMLSLIIWNFELPRLKPELSQYTARDSLTRKPTCCYIAPRPILQHGAS